MEDFISEATESTKERAIRHRAVRGTLTIMLARILSRLLAMVTVIAMLNYLRPQRYGLYQTVVTYTALVSILLDLGFNTLYQREAARYPEKAGEFLGKITGFKLILAVIVFVVLFFVLKIPGLGGFIFPAYFLVVFTSFSNLYRGTFYALGELSYEARAILGETVLLLFLTLAGIFTKQNVAYFLWSYMASYVFSFGYALVTIARKHLVAFVFSFDWRFIRSWFLAGLPLAFTFILTNIYFKIDVPMLQHFRNFVEVGWYTAAYKPFEALTFLPQAVLSVLFPIMSIYYVRSHHRLVYIYRKFFKVMLLMGFPLTVTVVVLSGPLALLLHLYPESALPLRILGVGIIFLFVNNAFIGVLNATNQQHLFTIATFVSACFNVGLNFILISAYGYVGASWSTVLTEIVLGLVSWYMVGRSVYVLKPYKDAGLVLLSVLPMAAVMFYFRNSFILIPLVTGFCVYAVSLYLFGAVTISEIRMIRREIGI